MCPIFNLKTTLRAFPKLSPSILENYVTKEELEQDNYVSHEELTKILDTTLADFVRDVDADHDANVIYGRQQGKWVPVYEINNEETGILCYGMNKSSILTSESLLQLNRQFIMKDVNEYLVEQLPCESGYFWFASTIPIREITANNGMEYRQPVSEALTVSVEYQSKTILFYCYCTPKLVALPGISYKFKVEVGR